MSVHRSRRVVAGNAPNGLEKLFTRLDARAIVEKHDQQLEFEEGQGHVCIINPHPMGILVDA